MLVKWDGRGLKVNCIKDVELRFSSYAIGYKIFQSSRPNSIPCGVVDISYKIVKKGLQFDLSELLQKKFEENL